MKRQKIKEIKEIARNPDKEEYIRCLATGKYFRNGVEITEEQWHQQPDKIIRIDLGPGIKPE
jgi:hypothetical protein